MYMRDRVRACHESTSQGKSTARRGCRVLDTPSCEVKRAHGTKDEVHAHVVMEGGAAAPEGAHGHQHASP